MAQLVGKNGVVSITIIPSLPNHTYTPQDPDRTKIVSSPNLETR